MKILVENIAKIQQAKVAIDGISVLAGYNANGKSTVSKSLNAIILAYTNILRKAERSRTSSINSALNMFLGEISSNGLFLPFTDDNLPLIQKILSKEIQLPEDYEHFRIAYHLDMDDEYPETSPEIEKQYSNFLAQLQKIQDRSIEEYIQFVVEGSILRSFDHQINTIGRNSIGRIVLSDDSDAVICETSFKGNRLLSCSYSDIKESNPLYLEPKHTLDDLPATSRSIRNRRIRDPILSNLLAHDEAQADTITIEIQEKLDRISALINEAIHGGLVENGDSLQYMDENSSHISLKNLASGNKTFAVIKRLLENGQLYKNQTLIIDEPEVNLHPEWQLILAKVLIILYKELGLKVFLNSHSPYFIRAIEACAKRNDMTDHCFFYQTIQGENGLYLVEDVTNEPEKIYQALYRPLEEL